MISVVGVFTSHSDAAKAVERLRSIGIRKKNRINLLAPETAQQQLGRVRTTDAEQPGMGPAVGTVVGTALGVAGGLTAGTAAASLLIPGVGPVVAVGLTAAAIAGAAGAAGGAAVGEALEESLSEGVPKDELFIYEDALRQGRTILIALAEDEPQADSARRVLSESGAETIDAAREQLWLGLRDVEQEHYQGDESTYRQGFEAAQHPELRGKTYTEAEKYLQDRYPTQYQQAAFRRGYERGQLYATSARQRRS